jgi:hypothetical protein
MITVIISSIIMFTLSLSARRKIIRLKRKYLRESIFHIIEENGSINIDVLTKKFNVSSGDIVNLIEKDLGKTLYFTKNGKTIVSKQYIKRIVLGELENLRGVRLSKLGRKILEMGPEAWKGDWLSLMKSCVFIIVGAWEGSELFDRLVAYEIAKELENRGIDSLVMTDKYWWEARDKHGYEKSPIISIGGPIVNSLSNHIAEKLKIDKYSTGIGVLEIEGQLVGYLWGVDAMGTLEAGKRFIESKLDEFVKNLK